MIACGSNFMLTAVGILLRALGQVTVKQFLTENGVGTRVEVSPANRYTTREPTSGLEPLTPAHYEFAVKGFA
jgi:hypothetical protein